MNERLNTIFIFKKREFQVVLQSQDCEHLPQPVLSSLLIHHQYEIKSNVSENVFQSTINYLANRSLPDITKEYINEYDQLSQELQIIQIIDLVKQKQDFFNEIFNNIKKLSSDSASDQSDIEHAISQNLDDYLNSFGDELIDSPIQSLCNILSYKDCVFNAHDRLYELIQSHYQKTKEREIFILLQFIDGNSISEENLIDSFRNESERFGFRPVFDVSSLFCKIHELENQIENQHNVSNANLNQKHNENQHHELNEDLHLKQNENQHQTLNDNQHQETNKNQHQKTNENQHQALNDNQHQKSNENQHQALNDNQHQKSNENQHQALNDNQHQKSNENQYQKNNNEHSENSNKSYATELSEIAKSNRKKYLRLTEMFGSSTTDELFINGVCFRLDKQHQTADITFPNSRFTDVFVPRSVTHNCVEYIVQGIGHFTSQNTSIKSITFSEDSEIKTVDLDRINCTSLQSVTLPAAAEKFTATTSDFSKLTNITVPHSCSMFRWEEGMLIGKSDADASTFDVLVFARKDIVKAKVPSCIKRILPYCFFECRELRDVEFSPDTKLGSIGSYAFCSSSIESFTVPPLVAMIGNFSFFNCAKLARLVFTNSTELRSIGCFAFYSTKVESVRIPPRVTSIGDYAFAACSTLNSVTFAQGSRLRTIGRAAFESACVMSIELPEKVKNIDGEWAVGLYNLTKVCALSEKCEWNSGGFLTEKSGESGDAFDVVVVARKDIERFVLPQEARTISSHCFFGCVSLKSVDFVPDSSLRLIGNLAFFSSSIECVSIPSSVTSIGDGAFDTCTKLRVVRFGKNCELCSIGYRAFFASSVEELEIPKKVKKIGDFAFSSCERLRSVTFEKDSELISIGDTTFDYPLIKSIAFPSNYINV